MVTWGLNYDGYMTVPFGLKDVVAISANFDRVVALVVPKPKIKSVTRSGLLPTIKFPTLPGQSYAVEYSTDLTPGSWRPVSGGNVSGTGNEMTVTDPDAAAANQRFYRLKLP